MPTDTTQFEAIRDSWDFWLSQHDVSVPEIIHSAVKESISAFLSSHEDEIVAAIASMASTSAGFTTSGAACSAAPSGVPAVGFCVHTASSTTDLRCPTSLECPKCIETNEMFNRFALDERDMSDGPHPTCNTCGGTGTPQGERSEEKSA